jgi:hypothetical protein
MRAPSSVVFEETTAVTPLFGLFFKESSDDNEFARHTLQIDERGIIQKYNESAVNSFGYSKEDTMGQNIKMLMPPEMAEKHDGYLQRYKVFSLPRIHISVSAAHTDSFCSLMAAGDGRKACHGPVKAAASHHQGR